MTRPRPTRLNPWRWIATKVCVAAGAVVALAALTAPVLACRGFFSEQVILLDAIPPVAENSEVIAKVEILDVQIRERPGLRPFPVARARVLQSIRGTADGQIVEIYAPETSCGGGLDHRSVGSQGFIAGRFRQIAGETLFSGTWTNRQIGKTLYN
jgi:hypothetical protein